MSVVIVERRPMMPEEREIVGRWEKPTQSHAIDWGCVGLPIIYALLGALVGATLASMLVYLVGGPTDAQWLRPALWLGLLLGTGAGIAYVALYGQHSRLFRRGYAEELATGQVEVWHCITTLAMPVEAPGTEALPGYLLQVDECQVLFLDSFHLGELAGDAPFPCRRFDVVLLPNTAQVVRVICIEGALEPAPAYVIDPAHETLPEQPVLLPGDLHHPALLLQGYRAESG